VCVPNVLHHDLVIAAANAGKMSSAKSRWP